MQISPNYSVEDWSNLNFSNEQDWLKAIDIFKDRIKGRFLDYIDIIEGYEFAGFAVMALDCLLIETLQQFFEGEEQTPERESKNYFINFLTGGTFKEYFTKDMAIMFYEQIRCGILHQAEIKENSRIRIDVPLVTLTSDRKGLIANRKLFHQQLISEFRRYVYLLRNPEEKELRENFVNKMNYICRITKGESLNK